MNGHVRRERTRGFRGQIGFARWLRRLGLRAPGKGLNESLVDDVHDGDSVLVRSGPRGSVLFVVISLLVLRLRRPVGLVTWSRRRLDRAIGPGQVLCPVGN